MADLATRVRRRVRLLRLRRWLLPPLLVAVGWFGPPQMSRFLVGDLRPESDAAESAGPNGWTMLADIDEFTGELPREYLKLDGDGRVQPGTWQWLAANGRQLRQADAAFQQAIFRPPPPDRPAADRLDTVRTALRLECAQAVHDAANGRDQAAVERFRRLLRATRQVTVTPSWYACTGRYGEALVADAAAVAARLAPAVDWGVWHPLADDLLRQQDRGDYLLAAQALDYYQSYEHTWHPERLTRLDDDYDLFRIWGALHRTPSVAYDPWRTLQRLRQIHARLAEEARRPRWDRDLRRTGLQIGRPSALRTLGRYNFIGECDVACWTYDLELNFADRADAALRLSATALAVRAYQTQHDELPESLPALRDAGLLMAVPLDPMDGRPLRYDPRRALLWSIHWDQLDDGGEPTEDLVRAVGATAD